MLITLFKLSGVMAALMSLRGKCVVAKATRKPGVANIITGYPPVISAINSVWPLNATPASLIMPLSTGPVTMASNSLLIQPSVAVVRVFKTYGLFKRSVLPEVTGMARSILSTFKQPA